MIDTGNSQLTLNLEDGLADRHLSLRDCMVQQVYQRGHGRMANLLDIAPSHLCEKLAGVDSGGHKRGMTLDEFERYLEKTGDTAPILYLVAKYLRDQGAAQQDALSKLSAIAELLPGMLAAAGLAAKGRRR